MNTPALNVLNDGHIVIYAKYGMTTTDPCYVGRPYGGVAVACKQRKNMQYTELDFMSDRIIGVKVCNNSDIVEIILCVYMPFYNGEAHQTDCYAETIDMLQSVIEQFGAICPIHIIGDLNAQLPKRRLLHRRWYRLPGFNTHSSILYDFINDNDLCVADFTDPQHVQYTYFCDSTATYTWIDNCLTTSQNIISCNIIPRHAANVSDHLPLCLQTRVLNFSMNSVNPRCYQLMSRTVSHADGTT